eukprot:scaffold266_cov391-Prasinococcus_capsulatus_cf.AAC.14
MCRLQQELLAAYRLSVPVSELLLLALSLETERKFGKLAQEALLACVKVCIRSARIRATLRHKLVECRVAQSSC